MPDEPLQPDVQPTDVAPPDPGLPLAPTAADGGADGGAAQADAPPDPGLPIGPDGPTPRHVQHAKDFMQQQHDARAEQAAVRPDAPPDPGVHGLDQSMFSKGGQEFMAKAARPDHRGVAGMRQGQHGQHAHGPTTEEKREAGRQRFEQRREEGAARLEARRHGGGGGHAAQQDTPPDPGAGGGGGGNGGAGGEKIDLGALQQQMGRIEAQNAQILALLNRRIGRF